MSDFLQSYGVEGPLGFPMQEKQARNLDTLLKALPKSKEYTYKKSILAKAPTELNPGERSDVSWISTETPDRLGDIIIAKGMNDAQFALNPIVTYNHSYYSPPIGRSLWRKAVKDGDQRGIKAKTVYPPKPDNWNDKEVWQPDQIFSQIQAGLLNAKSIGWLPTKAHFMDVKEAAKRNAHEGDLLVEEWLLIEYAVCGIPCNPETVVDAVSKSLSPHTPPPYPPNGQSIKFTPLEAIESALLDRVNGLDLAQMTQDTLDRMRGKI